MVTSNGDKPRLVGARQVFALTGYHPDYEFIESLGVKLDPESRKPKLNLETLESNVKGIYLAGVVVAGKNTNEIFIENGRFHGKQIVRRRDRSDPWTFGVELENTSKSECLPGLAGVC